ncbi:MAG: class I SAM-dependent methyltransferase [Dehalococcoidia bacterium]|nr:MAG: class I SAM-dependent methyltransferase [Dehalococcoidia bacterium]
MWYRLNRIEGTLFFLPFWVYASLKHIPYSTRCSRCGKRIFNYENCRDRLCEICLREAARNKAAKLHEDRVKRAINPCINPGEGHIYLRVASRIGHGKILDVGCGSGGLLSGLDPRQRELFGIDIIQGVAGEKNRHISFFVAEATDMPFESDIFDCVTCTEVLEHIESDDAIKECFRVLKPGGTALITVPNGNGPFGRLPEHLRLFDYNTIYGLLKNAGFQIIEGTKFGLYIPFLTRAMITLSFSIQRIMPFSHPLNISVPEFLATNFFFECRKPVS